MIRAVLTVIRRSTGYIVAAAVACAAGWTSSASVVPMSVLGQSWFCPGVPR